MTYSFGFPPADKLIETFMTIDYKKHLNSFMDAVVVACAFIAAIATITTQKWNEYDCTERLQLFILTLTEKVKVFYNWMKDVFIPFVVSIFNDLRSVYNYMQSMTALN